MNNSNSAEYSCFGCVFSFIGVAMAAFVFLVAGAVVAAIFYGIYQLCLWLFRPQPRLFGAPPRSRWSSTYEHAIYVLDSQFGIKGNTSASSLLMSVTFLTMIPVAGVLILLQGILSPVVSFGIFLVGLGIALATFNTLTNRNRWFNSKVRGLGLLVAAGYLDPENDFPQNDVLNFEDW